MAFSQEEILTEFVEAAQYYKRPWHPDEGYRDRLDTEIRKRERLEATKQRRVQNVAVLTALLETPWWLVDPDTNQKRTVKPWDSKPNTPKHPQRIRSQKARWRKNGWEREQAIITARREEAKCALDALAAPYHVDIATCPRCGKPGERRTGTTSVYHVPIDPECPGWRARPA